MNILLEINWLAVGQIILIDLLLGGDNAIVIALACRNLPANLRTKGIVWGTVGAIIIRIVLVAFAVVLLKLPYIKLVGGVLLFGIGLKLLIDDDESHNEVHGSDRLWAAVKTIIVADLVMSIDNVIAVSGAAERSGGEHQLALVVFGVLISIPIIVWGSSVVLKIMERFPIVITFGAALLGYLSGGMIFTDVGLAPWIEATVPHHEFSLPFWDIQLSIPGAIGAVLIVMIGYWRMKRRNH